MDNPSQATGMYWDYGQFLSGYQQLPMPTGLPCPAIWAYVTSWSLARMTVAICCFLMWTPVSFYSTRVQQNLAGIQWTTMWWYVTCLESVRLCRIPDESARIQWIMWGSVKYCHAPVFVQTATLGSSSSECGHIWSESRAMQAVQFKLCHSIAWTLHPLSFFRHYNLSILTLCLKVQRLTLAPSGKRESA